MIMGFVEMVMLAAYGLVFFSAGMEAGASLSLGGAFLLLGVVVGMAVLFGLRWLVSLCHR